MFFADKQAAFREALRVLKPGGRFLFEVWDRREEIAIQYTASEIVDRDIARAVAYGLCPRSCYSDFPGRRAA